MSTVKKVLAGGLIALSILISYAPVSAQAVPVPLPVVETNPALIGAELATAASTGTQATIMQVLNGLAWAVAKAAIRSMTQSVVNWINSGFEGSPAFATDLRQTMLRLGDGVAAGFVGELIDNFEINSPFLDQIGPTIAYGYLLYTSRDQIQERLRYTLNEYARNEEAYRRGAFNEGGFSAWFATVRYCGNDPYCAQLAAEDELARRLDAQLRQRLEELDWGRGFLSWRNCPDESDTGDTVTSLSETEDAVECPILTPGSVIENALLGTTDSPLRQLELADSINEIVGALASQLVSQVLGGTGLLGTSRPSSGGGRSYLQQYAGTPGTDSTLAAGFNQALREQEQEVGSYRTNWTTIRTAAESAIAVCSQGVGNDATQRERADEVKADADREIVRASSALTILGELRTRLAAVQQSQSATSATQSAAITRDYECLLSGGNPANGTCTPTDPSILPTGREMGQVARNAVDSGDGTPASLFTEMTRIANGGCD